MSYDEDAVNVGSVFSGIGGLDEGLRRAGHQHIFFCEWDAYRRDVLRARFSGVPVYEDVQTLRAGDDGAWPFEREPGRRAVGGSGGSAAADGSLVGAARVDLLCGGFPCQDLSVAGRRAGLAGDRSGLFFEFARIAESLRPGWLLVENVPGLLSSNGGRDFGVVLGTLADIGYGVAWRIVNSRFFGVPQRRRRVFIVGALADGDPRAAAERAGEVLAVGQGCARHLAPRGQAGQDVASPLGGSVGKGRGHDGNPFDRGGALVGFTHSGGETYRESDTVGALTQQSASESSAMTPLVAGTLKSQDGRGWSHDAEATYVAGPLDTRQTPQGHGMAGVNDQAVANNHVVAAPLTKGSATGEGVNAPGRRQEDDVNLVETLGWNWQTGGDFRPMFGEQAPALQKNQTTAVGVRRLTPTECERLQGFPDGWTQLGDTPDSRRYSALGDAVTVNVSEWIGSRLPP